MVATLVPLSAHADSNCTSNIIIFSAPSGLNTNALWCTAGDDPSYDRRLINPGSTGISVSYRLDLGADVPTLFATLDGLGFTHKSVKLSRGAGNLPGTFQYDSATISLPDGRTSSGCVTATVVTPEDDPDLGPESNSFHTIDTNC